MYRERLIRTKILETADGGGMLQQLGSRHLKNIFVGAISFEALQRENRIVWRDAYHK